MGGYSESMSMQELQREQLQLQEQQSELDNQVQLPCTFSAIGTAAFGGLMGSVFGFGSAVIAHKGVGRFAAARAAAWSQAKTFALLSGMFSFSSCIITRIRQVEDALSHGIAGCTTGFTLGCNKGPMAGLQSCLGFGVLSYFAFTITGGNQAVAAQTEILYRSNLMTQWKPKNNMQLKLFVKKNSRQSQFNSINVKQGKFINKCQEFDQCTLLQNSGESCCLFLQ
eukprot:TRINITY_DN2628_c0_g1_i4.p1 TRINITY_DN2628_c0_g1~~TRINITY_DN2628_c0_g1_i4.p1  ORF type:complete len:233 (-),score=25.34 TRINITY_DN2628_c0_g1_i4:119-793(-)